MADPRRGEVWLVDLGLSAKVRPCVVVSIPALDQDRALVTIVPHTTQLRQSRFETRIDVSFLKDGAFDVQNLITIPHAKLIRRLGTLSHDQMDSIGHSLRFWLGLNLTSNLP